MGCGTSFVKYVLFFFNLVVALGGLAIVGIGVAVLLQWSVMVTELKHYLTVAPWVFIIIGAVMFVIAFFGCCGAIRESHCMVVTYAIFLLVVIIVQVVLGVLLFTYSDSIKTSLVKVVDSTYDKRSTDTAYATIFNNIQQQLVCCGKYGAADYGIGTLNLDKSCCSNPGAVSKLIGGQCTIADANDVGCSTRVADLYEKWNKTIAGVAIGVACVEVVGALFALCLANSIRNMDRRYA
ncbi:CD63 antigen-like isoform X2 [Aricia agestis]|uniref:CD63 antigen-like isoform X2 n=1 Tax=Aricia agestis TaxID=91739 RepID=UPI001C20B15D|nr:CD63 antigen-like isoform X2 [Aricia agestis]